MEIRWHLRILKSKNINLSPNPHTKREVLKYYLSTIYSPSPLGKGSR
jgi:hypothetical protein